MDSAFAADGTADPRKPSWMGYLVGRHRRSAETVLDGLFGWTAPQIRGNRLGWVIWLDGTADPRKPSWMGYLVGRHRRSAETVLDGLFGWTAPQIRGNRQGLCMLLGTSVTVFEPVYTEKLSVLLSTLPPGLPLPRSPTAAQVPDINSTPPIPRPMNRAVGELALPLHL